MPGGHAQRLRNIRRAVEVLDELKMLAGCADCGFNAWPEALHFDHVEQGTKSQQPGWVRDRSKLTSRARLDRYVDHVTRYCEVRCANCHAHRTKVEKHWQWSSEGARQARDLATLF